MSKKSYRKLNKIQKQIDQIHRKIVGIDYICSGTLLKRTKVCGKPNCRCAQEPTARHGPYYEWSRREGGRLAHSVVPASQAKLFARAIAKHRLILRLLTRWERESVRFIMDQNDRKS